MRTWWLARGEHEVPAGDRWLTPVEAEWLATMRFRKRRTEYLLRRWVGKQAVSAVLGLPRDAPTAARIEVANRPDGSPVVFLDGAPATGCVSMSDRAGWAMCLVAEERIDVGCDLELVEPRSDGFVADFLTSAEQAAVRAAGAERDVVANLLWSAKESVLKVLRTGLRRDTRSVDVTLEPGAPGEWARLTGRLVEGGELPGWWQRQGAFLLTVAAARPLPPPIALEDAAVLSTAAPAHSWLTDPI